MEEQPGRPGAVYFPWDSQQCAGINLDINKKNIGSKLSTSLEQTQKMIK